MANLLPADGSADLEANLEAAMAQMRVGVPLSRLLDTLADCLRQAREAQCQVRTYRALVDSTKMGCSVAGVDGRLLEANAQYVRLSGHVNFEEIRDRTALEWTAPYDRERSARDLAQCVQQGFLRDAEIDYIDAGQRITPILLNAAVIETDSGPRLLSFCRDMTVRRQAQLALQAAQQELESRVAARTAELALANAQIRSRAQRQEVLASFGGKALAGTEIETLTQEAITLVCQMLDMEFGAVLEQASAASNLVVRANHGWPEGSRPREIIPGHRATMSSRALASRGSIAVQDFANERQVGLIPPMAEAGAVSGVSSFIRGAADRPLSVLCAHSTRRREFTPDDVHFVEAVANILASAIERKRVEETIRGFQHDAESANEAKSDFLSRMSHELRTPLNAILGFGQLLEIDALSTRQHESVDQIVRAGRRLLDLVDGVLDLARIEKGQIALSPEPVPLRALVLEAIDSIQSAADARRIELKVDAEGEGQPNHVLADRLRLSQVVRSLLSNAVKYNRENGRVIVAIRLGAAGNNLEVSVTDTGPGIAAERMPRLFIAFDRLASADAGSEGAGMGLALSKRLSEAMHGSITAESREGEGSTFAITVPLAVAPAPDFAPPELLEDILPAFTPALTRTVLHVEDSESNRHLVEMLVLQRPLVNLVSAASGERGLEMAHDFQPDLILLDMHLPDLPGDEVLRLLRADEDTRGIPVVIISADATAALARRLREAGVSEYLTKPFQISQFLRVLDDHLSCQS